MSGVIAEWAIIPFVGKNYVLGALPILFAFTLMIYSHRVRGESLRDIGFRTDNFVKALRLLALPMLAGALLIFAIGYWVSGFDFSHMRLGRGLLWLPAWGFVWGLFQQYILQGFVNRRAQEACGRNWLSILIVATIFGVLHMPNLWLMVATFVGGIIWAFVYQRQPNLFALALSHSLMTLVLVSFIPDWMLGGLRVGYNFLT